MKRTLIITSLGIAAVLSADPNYYNQPGYGSCPGSNCPYAQQGNQDAYSNRPYYNHNPNHGIQPYYEDWQVENMQPYNPQANQQGGYYKGQQGYYQNNQAYNSPNVSNSSNRNEAQPQNSATYRQNAYQEANRSKTQKSVSDQDIAHNVHGALSAGWITKGYPNVTFDVINGTVFLFGYVDSANDKNKLENSVRKLDGVRQVNNQVRVAADKTATAYYQPDSYVADNEKKIRENEKNYPQDYAATDADRQINAKIRDKISNGWFTKAYETIILRTVNGEVVISGTVEKQDDIKKLHDEIGKIQGVKQVKAQLNVKNPK